MIEIRNIERKEFESFNLTAKNQLFLQSWNYGELCREIGEKAFRFGVFESRKLVGISEIIKVEAKRGSHFFCPYGPVFTKWKEEYFRAWKKKMVELSRKEEVSFIRVSPFIENTKENKVFFKRQSFINAPMHVLAETTWLLDLNKDLDQILNEMRKTNRNLIRRAIRDGVEIKKGTDENAVEEFIKLHKDTKKKHHFTPYSDQFFRAQVKNFKDDDQILVFNAYHQGQLISSAIVMYYGEMAAYHHGASSLKHQKIPGSYLVQWEAIQEAKKRGCQRYNFWGVSPYKDKPHPISGVSHFKRGFGGYQYDLLHCQDLPLSPKYVLNYLVESFRRKKRGYYFKKPV